mgnify:CR=1 FL=1|jgi:dUTP pyrophosphatase
MIVKIEKLNPEAVIPTYAKDGDAGMDLVAIKKEDVSPTQVKYYTGLAMEIPYGYVGLIFPRSSVFKSGLSLSNAVGVIDSGYRGEIMAVFNKKFGMNLTNYEVGDRVAQIMILPYPQVEFVESDKLSETERGSGGFGSTGK